MKQSDEDESYSDGEIIQIKIKDINNNKNDNDPEYNFDYQNENNKEKLLLSSLKKNSASMLLSHDTKTPTRRPSIFDYLNEFENHTSDNLLQFGNFKNKNVKLTSSSQIPLLQISYSSDEQSIGEFLNFFFI